ncbi:MAG: hypothetical protein ACLSV2_12675 [Clostridium sp.]
MEEQNNVIAILDKEDVREFEKYTERKNSLEELKLILNSNTREDLMDKVEKDIGIINNLISQWWNKIEYEYEITVKNSEDVYINNYTGEIILKSI